MTDVIERCQLPREIIGLAVCGAGRGDEADLACCDGDRGQEGQWFEAIEKMWRKFRSYVWGIDDKDEVELCRFGEFGILDLPVDIDVGIAGKGRV